MAEFKDPACAEIILPLVEHAHAFVRMGALRALKELRCKDTLKPALEALQDPDAAVRVQAIGVIGFLKLEESIPALTALINDPDAHVRRAAVSALAFSQMKPAAETITRALKDDDWMVREMAAETLGLNVNGSIAADQLIGALGRRVLAGAAEGHPQPRQDEDRARGPRRSAIASTTIRPICARKRPPRSARSPIPTAKRSWPSSPTMPIRMSARMHAGRCSRSRLGKRGPGHRQRRHAALPLWTSLCQTFIGLRQWDRPFSSVADPKTARTRP